MTSDGNSAYLHYMAYLINEHSFVPYLDLFEINMPGTYLFHIVIGKFFGYSDSTLRFVNIAWLVSVFLLTWFIMKPFGRATAVTSCLLFGLTFLGFGPKMALEREALALIPIAISILFAIRHKQNNSFKLVNFFHGMLFAIVALIKPHLVLGIVPVLIYQATYIAKSKNQIIKSFLFEGAFALFGFLLIIATSILWLLDLGALEAFWEILSSYMPLYREVGDIEFRGAFADAIYILYKFTNFEELGVLLVASIFAVYVILIEKGSTETKRLSILLLSLSVVYSVCVVIGGRMLLYHWLVFMYFVSLGTAILIFSGTISQNKLKVFPLVLFILASMSVLHIKDSVFSHVLQPHKKQYANKREEQIKAYFDKNNSDNSKIQAIHWDLPTLMAMFDLKAIPATPYVVSLQFYHHVSSPYIKGLREDFIKRMNNEMPEFIINVPSQKKVLNINGPNSFPELKNFIEKYYYRDYRGHGFDIYRKIDNSPTK